MRRALRENGATVSMAAISSALLLLGRVVMESLEAKLLALSLLWATLYLLQRILVGKRRTSGHWLVQYTAWAAYYLPAPVAFSAASALYHSPSHINESMFLLLTLAMLVATTAISSSRVGFTNMRAYSLRDRRRGGYNFLMWLVLLVFLAWAQIPSPYWSEQNRRAYTGLSFLSAFYILIANTSYSTLDCQTKAVADCMKQLKSKSSTSSPFFDHDDANSHSSLQMLDCCSFPVLQGRDGEWVTVKDLFHECGDLPTRDKDICLSYSLCRLLARRYYGFPCTEEGDDMVRRFALADLGRRDDGYKRAFKTVEVQLAFLHDYFFTSSLPIIVKSGFQFIGVVDSVLYLVGVISFLPAATLVPMRDDQVGMIQSLVAGVPGMYMSWCVLFGMPMSLLVKNLLASYWRPIHTVFRKINCFHEVGSRRPTTRGLIRDLLFPASPNPNAQEVLIDPFQTHTDGAYWRNKIGQYSILQDYDRGLSTKKVFEEMFNRSMLSQPSYSFIKHLPVVEEEADMLELDNMRELIANTLRAIDGPPTNGTRSLKINMGSSRYDWWSWTCRQETHTDTILIWHIATCYCGMTPPHSYRHNSLRLVEIDTWYEVATALSRYCAYLVAFLPEFLPEHILTTKQVFQRVIQDAQRALGTEPMKEEEKCIKIQGLQLPDQHDQWTTIHKGIMLGRQLEKLNTWLRWKLMAEFWAETILYISPSDNAEAHIERLAKGGEFITHLWAMLSNAGILKRAEGEWHPPASTTKLKEPPKKMETAKARTQECPF